jgi:hypothetical protein
MKRLAIALFIVMLGTVPASAQRCGHLFPAGAAASRNGSLERSLNYLSSGIFCIGGDILGSVPWHYARGMIHYSLGLNPEAAADFALAAERELRWRDIGYHRPLFRGRIHVGWTKFYRGLSLYRGGQYAEALTEFDEAARYWAVREPLTPHSQHRFNPFGFELHRVFKGVSLEAAGMHGRGMARLRGGDAGGNSDLAAAATREPGIAAIMSAAGVTP